MSAEMLMRRVLEASISLSAQGDKLAWDAPPGAMTPELLAEIREHKAALLELLTSEPPDQLTRARKATRHPLPPGAPVCTR
jgi:TubC N-terminal docking domain